MKTSRQRWLRHLLPVLTMLSCIRFAACQDPENPCLKEGRSVEPFANAISEKLERLEEVVDLARPPRLDVSRLAGRWACWVVGPDPGYVQIQGERGGLLAMFTGRRGSAECLNAVGTIVYVKSSVQTEREYDVVAYRSSLRGVHSDSLKVKLKSYALMVWLVDTETRAVTGFKQFEANPLPPQVYTLDKDQLAYEEGKAYWDMIRWLESLYAEQEM